MDNKRRAKLCIGCKFLHIGVNVDHNHCNKSKNYWMHKRANGLVEGDCIYKL